MAMLRVFKENEGKITAKDICISRNKAERTKDFNSLKNGLEIYNQYAQKQLKAAFGKRHDWSIFASNSAPAAFSCGKVTGTTVLLNACSKLRSI